MVINSPNVKVIDVSGSTCCSLGSREAGVTLIEMMIVIAIAAILLATAAPSFRSTVVRWNIDSLVDDFTTAVATARTEAATRGRSVRVCANQACTANTWADGWFIVDSTGEVLQAFSNDGNYPISLKTEGGVDVEVITFNSAGYNQDETRYVFAVCEPAGPVQPMMRGVTVEFSGRAYQTDYAGVMQKARFDNGAGDGSRTEIVLSCN